MQKRRPPSYAIDTVLSLVCLISIHAAPAHSQPAQSPWAGIPADEARPEAGPVPIEAFTNDLSPRALSGDGRFVTFQSLAALIEGDRNNDVDVYLRDRQTGALTRVSSGPGGGDANGSSFSPTISSNGRYVAFLSLASDLVPGDLNESVDCFVYDREQHSTSRVNVGPLGEESATGCAAIGISGDGRYVVVDGLFDGGPSSRVWIRDRDADGNGIPGEAGLETMTEIPRPAASGAEQLFNVGWMTLSDDARFVSFTPEVYSSDWQYLGTRLYVHDRTTGVTTLIGPATSSPSALQYATEPDFGDTTLAYVTNAPNLVAGDTDLDLDVFVVDLQTGGHTRVELNHEGAPALFQTRAPAISADGRFVAFVGSEMTPGGIELRDVYAVDRVLGQSFTVSLRPDGQRATRVGDYPSIGADGTAIGFLAGPDLLVEHSGNDGIFVATDFALTPDTIDMPSDGGTMPIGVHAPATSGWEARALDFSEQLGLLELSPTAGSGPSTLEVTLPPNHTGEDREYWVIVGSEHAVVRQPSGPGVDSLSPAEGPPTGGTDVTIAGTGFAADASVRFGGRLATGVVVDSAAVIRAVTPAGAPGAVDVVVENGNGRSTRAPLAFTYLNATEIDVPGATGIYGGSSELRANLRDTSGPLAGRLVTFFIDDISVGAATTSSAGQAALSVPLAARAAGSHGVRVEFGGDAAAGPASGNGALSIAQAPLRLRADDTMKRYGQALPAFSVTPTGLVNGETLAALDGTLTFLTTATPTSAPGSYPLAPGGLSSTNYSITFVAGTLVVLKAETTVSVVSAPNPSKKGNDYDLLATVGVVAPGAGVPTGSVNFYEGSELLGSAQLHDGVATLTVRVPRRGRLINVVYLGDLNFAASGGGEAVASSAPRR